MGDRDDLRGFARLHTRGSTKGTAFTEEERDRYGLRGLLPPQVLTMEQQMARVLENLRRKPSDIEKYIFLSALQNRNERLFYRTVIENLPELMPLIYTPTVGQACKEFAHIFREPRGLYVTAQDRGRIGEVLGNWPERDIEVIVVTDGQRILGLGDLGANGMGIPLGKLALYTACAGIHPRRCLPVMLDVGTNNEELLADPLYLGLRQKRIAGDAYDDLVEELVVAVAERFPLALLQFEDFQTANAFRLLGRYRNRILSFNDDIQGTAAVALAGVYAAARATGASLRDLSFLFLGAGSAATGIGQLVARALEAEGLTPAAARRRLWFVNSKGLLVASRRDVADHQRPFAHDHPGADFLGAIRSLRPQVLIGATGSPQTFTRDAIGLMAELNERPVIFALSNPTSRAECTAEQAYAWSEGRALFASGSPFPPIDLSGRRFQPAQGNNVYIFPGVGLGALAIRARKISDGMFLAAARALAERISDRDLAAGALYPPLSDLREISLAIATAVARHAHEEALAQVDPPRDLEGRIRASMYMPHY